MIRITSFAKPKSDSKSNTTVSSGGYANTITSSKVKGVYLWGNYHDHTNDISGDLSSVGNITGSGTLTMPNILTNTITPNGDSLAISGNTNIDGTLTTKATTTDTLKVNTLAEIEQEKVNQSTIQQLNAVKAIIEALEATDIVVDNLTVTKAAHFFKLIIDEIKASQGQIILTPANATIDYVEAVDGGYKCYFKATDGEDKILNSFEANDQVVCQTFNAAEGTSYDVSNKFYWRLCTETSSSPVTITVDGVEGEYHYIILSDTDKDASSNDIPAKGDEVVMLGNRTDTTRQNAISLGAYNNPYLDKDIKAPFIIQYGGIDDYDLSQHRLNVISNGYNHFKGVFKTETGKDIQEEIENINKGNNAYLHIAYSTSADGSQDFSKTVFENASYLGLCSNYTEDDSTLTYSDYKWSKIKGDNGTNGTNGTNGKDGTSVTIKSTSVTYVRSSSGYDTPTSGWSTSIPISEASKPYLWTRTIVTYSDNTSTTSYSVSYNGQDGKDGTDGTNGSNGKDGVTYQLVPTYEKFVVDKNKTILISLSYTVVKIEGTTVTTVSTSTSGIYVTAYVYKNNSSTTQLSLSTGTNPIYSNTNYDTYDSSSSTRPTHIRVILRDSSNIYDSSIIPLVMEAAATFEITDEITSTVQGNTSSINSLNSQTSTNTNSISTLNQKYNSISSTVESHTTSIDNLSGKVTQNTTNISNIQQTADSITSKVTELEDGIEANTSLIQQTAESILQQVGDTYIKVDSSNITLGGDTTVVGSLTITNEGNTSNNKGFILQGVGGMTEISTQNLPTYYNFTNMTTYTLTPFMQTTTYGSLYNNNVYEFDWVVNMQVGTFSKGTVLTIGKYTGYVQENHYGNGYGSPTYSNPPTGTYTIYEDNTLKQSISITTSTSSSTFDYTVSADSTITILFKTSRKVTITDLETDTSKPIAMPHERYCVSLTITYPNTDKYCLIACDGIGLNFGNSSWDYYGSERSWWKYGTTEFGIKSDGIYYNNKRNVKVVSGAGTTSSPISYTVVDPIDTVLCLATNSHIYLPSSPYEGQVVRIYDKSSNCCYITSMGKYVVEANAYGTGSVYTKHELGQRLPHEFVYLSGKWYDFYSNY